MTRLRSDKDSLLNCVKTADENKKNAEKECARLKKTCEVLKDDLKKIIEEKNEEHSVMIKSLNDKLRESNTEREFLKKQVTEYKQKVNDIIIDNEKLGKEISISSNNYNKELDKKISVLNDQLYNTQSMLERSSRSQSPVKNIEDLKEELNKMKESYGELSKNYKRLECQYLSLDTVILHDK